MISLLKSKFDQSRKRAVFITAEAIAIFHWFQGGVTDSFVFEANDAGLVNFDRYLRETATVPTYLLVDMVEEEYRQESIPHVFGADRKSLLSRKQAWLFRSTPYCNAVMQGRESEGRRDDRVLFTALMNPEVVTPWVRLCTNNKVPLAGIYSLPLLSERLLPRLGIKSPNTLLVTVQSTSGLRQSFFRDGALKISRLAKMPRLGSVPFAPYVLGELAKLRRYMQSLRMLAGAPLDIFLIAHGDLLDELAQECVNSDTVRHHLIDVTNAARSLGIQGVLTTPFSDYLYAHLLLQNPPKNHYATSDERNYYTFDVWRKALWATGITALVGGVIISGKTMLDGMSLREQAAVEVEKANFYQARFSAAKRELPATAVPPVDIKTAVDLVDSLASYKANPFGMMTTVSQALDQFPTLRIEELEWSTNTDPRAGLLNEGGVAPPAAPAAGTDKYYQIAIVKGAIEPFDGNYRVAIDVINRFADSLRAQPAVRDVQVLLLPLDVSSKSSLQGDAARLASVAANFSLRVVLGGKGEAG